MTIRQFSMLSEFSHKDFTVNDALKLQQTTFGSLCRHKWVDFNAHANTFVISNLGYQKFAFNNDHKRLRRLNTKRPLSQYAPKRALKVVSIQRSSSKVA